MMRALMTFVVLGFFLTSSEASAQSFAEVEMDGVISVKLNLEKSFTPNDGLFLWTIVTPDWAETYGGFTVRPVSWAKVGFGVGVETAKHPLRLGLTVLLTKKRLSSLTIVEDGGSGRWYKHTTTVNVRRRVNLGVISQAGQGTGALIEVLLDRRFTISGAVTGGDGGPKGLVALSKGF